MIDDCEDDREAILAEIALLTQVRRATLLAIEALVGGAQSYQLDTGQTRQLVSKPQLASLQLTYSRLGTEIRALQMQIRSRVVYVRPGW
jgi:hypothetical protein